MIRIMLHDLDKDHLLSYKESRRMVESYWSFCHKDCCGDDVEYDQKECWFCECHEEHDDNETVCDTVEWIVETYIFGIKL